MLTKQQIDQFTKEARARGFSEIQIANEIARKNQELTRSKVQPSQNMQTTPMQTPAPTQNQPSGNQNRGMTGSAGDAVASFLIPRINTFRKTVTGALDLNRETSALEKANEELHKRSRELIVRARKETDPLKRQQYLEESRELNSLAAKNTEQLMGKAEELKATSGIKDTDTNPSYATRQGIGITGEAATWVLPMGKIVQGSRLIQGTSLVSKILRSAVTGSTIGATYGITSPEDLTLDERGKRTLSGAATGGVASGILTGVSAPLSSAARNFIKTNSNRVSRLFRVNPSDRANFRKSTGGMDFAEEILKRDAQNIKGMNHDELTTYFKSRLSSATKEKAELLKGSKQEVQTKPIINKVNQMIKDRGPKKGNVGQEEVVKALKKQLADLKKNPENLTSEMADKIKSQIQNLGRNAYDANGKPTATSKAMAELGTFVKELVEEGVDGIKEANRTIQLYQLASKSIERTGDREANKITNDIVQKFLQVMPTAAAVGGGFGGYALGGASGGAIGLTLGLLIPSGAGAARTRYLSPETQTKLISELQKVATNQGIKNASKWASKISNAVTEVMARKSSQMVTDRPSEPSGLLNTLQSENTQYQTQSNLDSESLPSGSDQQMEQVTIRNKKTGEVKTVSQSELGQYGIGDSGSIPNKEDILVAMFADMQATGGKNLSKLNTLLSAYESVFGEEETKLTEDQRKQLAGLSKAQDIVEMLSREIYDNLGVEEDATKARISGASRKLSAKIGRDEKVSSFSKVRYGLRTQMARALGEVGNLSEPEQKAALDLLPDITMSRKEIDENVRLIKEILDQAKERTVATY